MHFSGVGQEEGKAGKALQSVNLQKCRTPQLGSIGILSRFKILIQANCFREEENGVLFK